MHLLVCAIAVFSAGLMEAAGGASHKEQAGKRVIERDTWFLFGSVYMNT